MTTKELDPQAYTQLPRLDVARATALTTSLVSAMPAKMPGHVATASKAMVAAKDQLLESWRNEPIPTLNDRRPADLALDRAWAACHACIKAYATLPVDDFPKAKRAAELLAKIFPDGLTFLKLPYNMEWAESEKRLQMVDAENLADDISATAGPEFLVQVRKMHTVYGEVLGITKPSAETQAPVRAENLRNLRQAVGRYVFGVLSQVSDDDSSDLALTALRPIAELRTNLNTRRLAGIQYEDDDDYLDDVVAAEEPADDSVEPAPVSAIQPATEIASPNSSQASDSAAAMNGADSVPAAPAVSPDCG